MIRTFFLRTLNKYASKWLVLLIDIFLVFTSFFIAYFIRFNVSFNFNFSNLLNQIPYVLVFALISFLTVGSYKGIIRHTGVRDAFNVFIASSLVCLLLLLAVTFNVFFKVIDSFYIPKSIIVIHYLVTTLVLILSRFIFKAFFEVLSTELDTIHNVLIYGAGDSGIIAFSALNRDKKNNYDVIGFIDDNKNKIGKKIDRVKIHNPKHITKQFIEKHAVDEVIISIQNIKPNRLLAITDKFIDLDVDVKIVPPLSKWIDGDLNANQIRQIKIEDLLDRAPIIIDNPIVQREVNDKVILVSGAAGSIGSEISRQLSLYNCKMIILIDQAESPLYDLQQELIQKGITNFVAIVSDVRDRFKVERIFKKYKPQRVFHAAAYKHVPLMEKSPYEAIKVNVLGTKNLADLSVEYKIERFVMVSTDKAVNPTNVMGASKRIAELYISCVSKKSKKTKFTITRFGNVLGSNGSVIPLFKRQIENGGPLTVTHKKITRYFMTIPEACSLVLEAGTMGKGGEIYIFDMGKSVKIFEIAKRMIYLSGLRYPEDIDIKITGLRPGEKLYEELLADGENTTKTYHDKIMIAKTQKIDNSIVKIKIDDLSLNFDKLNNSELVALMKTLVPEYVSNNSEFEILDVKLKEVNIK
ncbi:nucleoside-diphosphate sugar epimerase/dehydratase [Polaribacter undariae]|uniref:Nucleoside-diphosphate sugar epimerase/dehydratase n=1 Tax=Polaribacter sejongensis TaxID=985043 RepID=A0AAJ1QWA6_9FLAO|nr:nucleoside-diphosphate sugar epimerase/dehydratase [Polaribacter undariae]MDN3619160.1 nucleoside-diphosphate sugar epimerase/dehydratase [Polaribacter undariae]UWD33639.1 polysaccharide biosynthesis protein [Polaribacter undariae]